MQELIQKILAVYNFVASSAEDAEKLRVLAQAQELVDTYINSLAATEAEYEELGKDDPSFHDLIAGADQKIETVLEDFQLPNMPATPTQPLEPLTDTLLTAADTLQSTIQSSLESLRNEHTRDKAAVAKLDAYIKELNQAHAKLSLEEDLLRDASVEEIVIPSISSLADAAASTSGSTAGGDPLLTPDELAGLPDDEEIERLFGPLKKRQRQIPDVSASDQLINADDPTSVVAIMRRLQPETPAASLSPIANLVAGIKELENYVGKSNDRYIQATLAKAKAAHQLDHSAIAPAVSYLIALSSVAIEKNKTSKDAHIAREISKRLMLGRRLQADVVNTTKTKYEKAVSKLSKTESSLGKLWTNPNILRLAWAYTKAEISLAEIDRALALNANKLTEVKALDKQIESLATHIIKLDTNINETEKILRNLNNDEEVEIDIADAKEPGDLSEIKSKTAIPVSARPVIDPNILFHHPSEDDLRGIGVLLEQYLNTLGIAYNKDAIARAKVEHLAKDGSKLKPGQGGIKITLTHKIGPASELTGSGLRRADLPQKIRTLAKMEIVLQEELQKTLKDAKTLTDENELQANFMREQQIKSYLRYIEMAKAWINHHQPTKQQKHLAYYGEKPSYIEGDTQPKRIKAGLEKVRTFLAKYDPNVKAKDTGSLEVCSITGSNADVGGLKVIDKKIGEQVLYYEGKISLSDSEVSPADKNKPLHYAGLQFISPTTKSLRTGFFMPENELQTLASLPVYDPAVMTAAYKLVQTHAAELAEMTSTTQPGETWTIHKGKMPDNLFKAILIVGALQDIRIEAKLDPRTQKAKTSVLTNDDPDLLRVLENFADGEYAQIRQDNTLINRATLKHAERQFHQVHKDKPVQKDVSAEESEASPAQSPSTPRPGGSGG